MHINSNHSNPMFPFSCTHKCAVSRVRQLIHKNFGHSQANHAKVWYELIMNNSYQIHIVNEFKVLWFLLQVLSELLEKHVDVEIIQPPK